MRYVLPLAIWGAAILGALSFAVSEALVTLFPDAGLMQLPIAAGVFLAVGFASMAYEDERAVLGK